MAVEIWRAQFFAHHQFEAFGSSEREARSALAAGLKIYTRERGLPRGWWLDYFSLDAIKCRSFKLGSAYCDSKELV